jgi:hypothetical protein
VTLPVVPTSVPDQSSLMVEPLVLMTVDQFVTPTELPFVSVTEAQ